MLVVGKLRYLMYVTVDSGANQIWIRRLKGPMQFDGEAKHDAALRHATDNREGSMGGTGVSGGGCGCN